MCDVIIGSQTRKVWNHWVKQTDRFKIETMICTVFLLKKNLIISTFDHWNLGILIIFEVWTEQHCNRAGLKSDFAGFFANFQQVEYTFYECCIKSISCLYFERIPSITCKLLNEYIHILNYLQYFPQYFLFSMQATHCHLLESQQVV